MKKKYYSKYGEHTGNIELMIVIKRLCGGQQEFCKQASKFPFKGKFSQSLLSGIVSGRLNPTQDEIDLICRVLHELDPNKSIENFKKNLFFSNG